MERTEIIINERWFDFMPTNRAPSKWGEYDTICTNWMLSRDPCGKLSILYLFLLRWEIILLAMILDVVLIIIVAFVDKILVTPIADLIKTFTSKFLGVCFAVLAVFISCFIIYFIIKSGLCGKLFDTLSALFVS